MNWTPEAVDALKALWMDGLSCSVIGARIGATRNAVIGKVHRLDLPKRRTLVSQKRKRDTRPKYSQRITPRLAVKRSGNGHHTYVHRRKEQEAPVIRVPVVLPEPASLDLTILTLQPGQCRWAHGDGPFLFCGHPTDEGMSYCPHHYARTIQPQWRRKAMSRRDGKIVGCGDHVSGRLE